MTEPQRLALHEAAREALGDEEGDTLMALTPPADTDMATMQGLDRVEERLGMRMVALEERLDGKMGALKERNRSHTRKVVVGTGVVLYLASAATLIAGLAVLVQVLGA